MKLNHIEYGYKHIKELHFVKFQSNTNYYSYGLFFFIYIILGTDSICFTCD